MAELVRLPYRPPYDWGAVLRFLEARAVEGVERVEGDAYERTVRHGAAIGSVRVSHLADEACLGIALRLRGARAREGVLARLGRVFDVDADVGAMKRSLRGDPLLAPMIRARPGLRVPGGFDGFELAMKAVLGQQVTVVAGKKLGGQLVRLAGKPLPNGRFLFPTAREVVETDLEPLGMPRSRKATLRAVAEAALADDTLFDRGAELDATLAKLRAIRGVGDWTAQYIALRAAREPDAFPASDVALLRAAGMGLEALRARAEAWRPYRAYAAQHLWASLTGTPA